MLNTTRTTASPGKMIARLRLRCGANRIDRKFSSRGGKMGPPAASEVCRGAGWGRDDQAVAGVRRDIIIVDIQIGGDQPGLPSPPDDDFVECAKDFDLCIVSIDLPLQHQA